LERKLDVHQLQRWKGGKFKNYDANQNKGQQNFMNTQYTNEPSANGTNKITIKEGSGNFGNEKIIEKSEENGTLKILTAYDGQDDSRKALIEKTYLIVNTQLSITKKVTFNNSGETLTRNRFTYSKI